MILSRGGTNDKLVWSSPASEKGTRKSREGSPAVWCRARSFRKLAFKRSAHFVGCRSKEDQSRAEKAMGEGEGSSVETEAHDVSSRKKENRGGTAGKVGEGTGGAEEGGVESPAFWLSSKWDGLDPRREINCWDTLALLQKPQS